MTRWRTTHSEKLLADRLGRRLLQLAARGEFRLSEVARLSRRPAPGTIRRARRALESVVAGG